MTSISSCDFQTVTHGKWILAGEHAVLRGKSAIVFPVANKTLTLEYCPCDEPITAEFSGESSHDTHLLFWSVLEHGMALTGHSLSDITGKFSLHNMIPLGAGMGASAALCAALARWFVWKDFVDKKNLFHFAQKLEDLFHGTSSGIDILGALSDHGMLYSNQNEPTKLEQQWQPHWYLSHSDQLGATSHCIQKVDQLWQEQPERAQQIDEDMQASVNTAQEALLLTAEKGLTLLATAINNARVCFSQWGLARGQVEQHINALLSHGALAAKPTGSGDGGYVLSLWASKPENAPFDLFIAQ